ncbi:MAG: DNA modification methylase [Myxococcota bacterium]|jgi:DNA modification methylase
MAKKKRAKRQSIRNLDLGFTGGEPLYGLEGLSSKPAVEDDRRTPGPAAVDGLRTDGDPEMAAMLAQALSHSGREDRETHGFHTYPAGMNPNCAAEIIEACPGAVHDPFCGGGTVLVEAMLSGRQSSGTDISPISTLVTRARTAPVEMATPVRAAARRITDYAKDLPETMLPDLASTWYEQHVAEELGRLRDGIRAEPAELQTLLWAIFSSILVKTSYRESDTSNNRVPTQRPIGTTLTLFHKKARLFGRMLESMPTGMPRPHIELGDAREVSPPWMVDLILTSPPYPGVYDYLPMQQLRYAWLDLDPGAGLAHEIGSRRDFRARGRTDAIKEWETATRAWIRTQAQALNPGGRLVVIVGDGLVASRNVDTLDATVRAMESAGLFIYARASADRPDHARGETRTEHIVMGAID